VVAPRDETGQPLVTHDETGQTGPAVRGRDETGQLADEERPSLAADSLLRPLGPGGVIPLGGLEGGVIQPGGHDYGFQLAIVEGYNSNVVQTQDAIDGPVTRHPSPFTGIDAIGHYRTWTSPVDAHEFRLQLRGQHYTPLDGYDQKDDGSVNGAWAGQFTVAKRTIVTGRMASAVSTVNSARLSDGALFQVDPGDLQRVYSLSSARFTVIHELAPRWRFTQGADVDVSITLRDTPSPGSPKRRGLDYVQPGTDSTLLHDFDERNIGSVRVAYAPTYTASILDYSTDPPSRGKSALLHRGEAEVGLAHAFSERFRSLTNVGALIATAPPLDEDRRPIISPVVSQELVYSKPYWITAINGTYTYGSATPRLGFGPALSGGITMEGTPLPNGPLRKLDVILSALASRAAFRQGPGSLSRLSFVATGVEFRYGISPWLGLLGGYNMRYSTFEGPGAFPSLLRHVVFVGLSGYWPTDRTVPTLQTFVSPVRPPG
jgi:hypothetical protein